MYKVVPSRPIDKALPAKFEQEEVSGVVLQLLVLIEYKPAEPIAMNVPC